MLNTHFYFFLNLTIIIPVVIGLFRYKNILNGYNIFSALLTFGFLNELLQIFIVSNFSKGIISTVYGFIETQCYLILFLKWRNFKRSTIINFQIFFFFVSLIGFLLKLNSTGISIEWSHKIQLLILVVLAIPILTQKTTEHSRSQKFIIVPFVVFSLYFIVLNILMHFLFNKSTQPLFVNLYSIITIINFLSYISYSFAIIWAPKREQFL